MMKKIWLVCELCSRKRWSSAGCHACSLYMPFTLVLSTGSRGVSDTDLSCTGHTVTLPSWWSKVSLGHSSILIPVLKAQEVSGHLMQFQITCEYKFFSLISPSCFVYIIQPGDRHLCPTLCRSKRRQRKCGAFRMICCIVDRCEV